MLKRNLFWVFALMLLSPSAFASHCPKDLKYIDDNMMKNPISASQMKVVMALRSSAIQFHNNGDHEASVIALHNAAQLLELDPPAH